MSNTKHSETDFKNEATVVRRAWIDRAVNGARASVSDGEPQLVVKERVRPRLYLVGARNKS